MTKKIVAFVLVLLLAFAIMTGCDSASSQISASKLIKNAELMNGMKLYGLDYSFVQLVEYDFEYDIITKNKLGLASRDVGGDFLHNICGSSSGEWEIFTFIDQFEYYGVMGHLVDTGYYDGGTPTTKEEAVRRVMRYLDESAEKESNPLHRTCMSLGFTGQHYAARAGYTNIGVEIIGINNPYELFYAMTRGAAKQNGVAWYADFSPWFSGSALNYENYEETSATGTSLNLMERARMYLFWAGGDGSIAEGGAGCSVYPDGTLTPYGEMLVKQYEFVQKYADIRGTTYVPLAYVLSDDFGLMPNKETSDGLGTETKSIEDMEYLEFVDQVLWKDSMGRWEDGELQDAMTNAKYGDSLDFLMEGVSADILNLYNAVLLNTGEPSKEDTLMYADFVKNGGTLVIHNSYSEYFNNYAGTKLPTEIATGAYQEIKNGNGSYIVFGNRESKGSDLYYVESMWDYATLEQIWDLVYDRNSVFTYSTCVGNTLSVSDDAKTLYLFVSNNDGVTKVSEEPEVIDQTKAIDLSVTYRGIENIVSVSDIYNDHDVQLDGNTMSLHLGAGDFAVLEIKLG